MMPTGMMYIQLVLASPCRMPKMNKSRRPPEKVRPTAMFSMWAIM